MGGLEWVEEFSCATFNKHMHSRGLKNHHSREIRKLRNSIGLGSRWGKVIKLAIPWLLGTEKLFKNEKSCTSRFKSNVNLQTWHRLPSSLIKFIF